MNKFISRILFLLMAASLVCPAFGESPGATAYIGDEPGDAPPIPWQMMYGYPWTYPVQPAAYAAYAHYW